jgi:4-hydroxythreonine-4-phosphate dehydrogenase
MSQHRPRIVITLGDPAGIGPEVVLKALQEPALYEAADFTVCGDLAAIAVAERSTGYNLAALPVRLHRCNVLSPKHEVVCGQMRAEYGRAAMEAVREATQLCLRNEADAMVTAPLNKEAVVKNGIAFSGHTEYIAELCGTHESRMLLASDALAVVHVTTHVSLRRATELSQERIVRTVQMGHSAMQLLGNSAPHIAVCGLNPHAGEHGLFGEEDEQIIRPAVAACAAMGIRCEGPVAADTIFLRASQGSHDLVVAMYHDQGHIPMKLLAFDTTVNISLGLPIIRTSVDHGTAFDIAGQNRANPANMRAALRRAIQMAHHRRHSAEQL